MSDTHPLRGFSDWLDRLAGGYIRAADAEEDNDGEAHDLRTMNATVLSVKAEFDALLPDYERKLLDSQAALLAAQIELADTQQKWNEALNTGLRVVADLEQAESALAAKTLECEKLKAQLSQK